MTVKYRVGPAGNLVIVNFNDLLQTMDGFGAADRNSVALDSTLADLFFSQSSGIGLSLLRTPMYSDGTGTGNPNNLTLAAARGAKIWMAPWTAPGAWKDNGTDNNGGHLLSAHYADWADRMCGFQATVNAASGVNLYAISVQNEPDFTASYDSMIYTNAEMLAFVKVLGPKLAALSPVPLIMLPECSDSVNHVGYVSAVKGDGVAAPYLGLTGWHQYDSVAASTIGQRSWQTEMSYFGGFDASINQALVMAADIHAALTVGNVSAWHYWELTASQSDNEGLIGHDGGTQTTKRVYVMGNFSKFVRPGHTRVGMTGTISNLSVTAYRNVPTGDFVVVAINSGGITMPLYLDLEGLAVTTVTPWCTSAALDLAAQQSVNVASGLLSVQLPALSVTSFVGTGT